MAVMMGLRLDGREDGEVEEAGSGEDGEAESL